MQSMIKRLVTLSPCSAGLRLPAKGTHLHSVATRGYQHKVGRLVVPFAGTFCWYGHKVILLGMDHLDILVQHPAVNPSSAHFRYLLMSPAPS